MIISERAVREGALKVMHDAHGAKVNGVTVVVITCRQLPKDEDQLVVTARWNGEVWWRRGEMQWLIQVGTP